MRKLIFRDKVYYFKIYRNPCYTYHGSKVKVYVPAEGFWSLFFRYKKIASWSGAREYANQNTVISLIKNYWEAKKTIVVDCSPEVTEIYKLEDR